MCHCPIGRSSSQTFLADKIGEHMYVCVLHLHLCLFLYLHTENHIFIPTPVFLYQFQTNPMKFILVFSFCICNSLLWQWKTWFMLSLPYLFDQSPVINQLLITMPPPPLHRSLSPFRGYTVCSELPPYPDVLFIAVPQTLC